MEDARGYQRRHTPRGIVLFEQMGLYGYGDMLDISQGGMRLRTLDPLGYGPVSLIFRLPLAKLPLDMTARVVWIEEGGSTEIDLGIEFIAPAARPAGLIKRFYDLQRELTASPLCA